MVHEHLINMFSQYGAIFTVILTRIGATFSALTFFRREVFPARIAILFSMSLTFFVLASERVHPLPISNDSQWFYSLLIQLFLGFVTALIINIFIEIFMGLGQIVSMQSGLGFANLMVPRVGAITPISEFFMITATLVFFNLNGHLVLIKMIIESFHMNFLLFATPNKEALNELLLFSKIIFSGSLMLSLSVLIALLISNITIAVITKFSPQLNIFTIGINISMLICFFALYVSFDLILENGQILLNECLTFLNYLEYTP